VTSRSRIGVGVIGVGATGHVHTENLAAQVPGAALAAVADVNGPAARACAEELGVAHAFEDYRELLAHPEVQAVVICSPRGTHARAVAEAAAAGKHVFCEKPIGCAPAEIDAALAAVQKAGVKLQTGFNRRFDPDFRHVRDTIVAGAIGKPVIVHLVSRDPPQAGDGAGTIADLFLETTVHDLDMARYLTASEIESVYAIGSRAAGRGAEEADAAVTTLPFAGGAIGTIDNSLRSAFGYDQRAEVFGDRGAISTANETAHRATLSDSHGVHSPLPLPFFRERYAASYVAEMRAFIDCIRDDSDPPVTGADGRAAVMLALAAMQSYREGRPVSPAEIEAAAG